MLLVHDRAGLGLAVNPHANLAYRDRPPDRRGQVHSFDEKVRPPRMPGDLGPEISAYVLPSLQGQERDAPLAGLAILGVDAGVDPDAALLRFAHRITIGGSPGVRALDKRYDYFFRLYGNGQPPYTELRLRASLEYLRWQREAVRLKLDGERKNRLVDMYQLNKRILESAAQSTAVSEDWYRQLVLSQIRNLYLLQSEIELPDEAYAFQSSGSIQSNQELSLDLYQQRLEDIQRTSAAKGRSLLQELIDRFESNSEAADLASIYLELGDWHQWNEKSRRAHHEYARVVQILKDAGETQLLEQWLGSPAELPANGAFWQPDRTVKDGRRVVLSAEYDVSARGNARNIQVSAAKPEDEVFSSRLRRKLLATRFRPRFASGEAETVERVSREYELIVD